MEELIDLIVTDSSPSTVSDRIKDLIYAKSAEKIDAARPVVAAAMFGEQPTENEFEEQDEVSDNYEEDNEEDE
jgi:hypothetical protein